MKTKEEITKWLLDNAVNEDNDLDLRDIDLSKFDGDVLITGWKVKNDLSLSGCEVGGDLFQNSQNVKGDLWQDSQKVKGNLYQHGQKVNGDLFQGKQQVEGKLYSHRLEDNERWGIYFDSVIRIKILKPITKEELADMGYVLKEGE